MQNRDELIELVEHAASAINSLTSADLSEVRNLQIVLQQINQVIRDIDDGPAELLEQVKGTAFDATWTLQTILQKEVKDTEKSIEATSQAISALQNLIELYTVNRSGPNSASN